RRPPAVPFGRSVPNRDRARDPNAICCWARSTASLLRSCSDLSHLFRARFAWVDGAEGSGALGRSAHKDLLLRVGFYDKPGAAQHRRRAGAVWHPPIRAVAGITMLDERQSWKPWAVEDRSLGEWVILFERRVGGVTPL